MPQGQTYRELSPKQVWYGLILLALIATPGDGMEKAEVDRDQCKEDGIFLPALLLAGVAKSGLPLRAQHSEKHPRLTLLLLVDARSTRAERHLHQLLSSWYCECSASPLIVPIASDCPCRAPDCAPARCTGTMSHTPPALAALMLGRPIPVFFACSSALSPLLQSFANYFPVCSTHTILTSLFASLVLWITWASPGLRRPGSLKVLKCMSIIRSVSSRLGIQTWLLLVALHMLVTENLKRERKKREGGIECKNTETAVF